MLVFILGVRFVFLDSFFTVDVSFLFESFFELLGFVEAEVVSFFALAFAAAVSFFAFALASAIADGNSFPRDGALGVLLGVDVGFDDFDFFSEVEVVFTDESLVGELLFLLTFELIFFGETLLPDLIFKVLSFVAELLAVLVFFELTLEVVFFVAAEIDLTTLLL